MLSLHNLPAGEARRGMVAVIAILLLTNATAASAATYTFANVADTDGPYLSFPQMDVNCPLNDDGTVAFVAEDATGTRGVFTGTETQHDVVADVSGPYTGFGTLAIANSGTVTFCAQLDAGGEGIFTGPDPGTDTLVDTSGLYSLILGAARNNAVW